MTNRQRQCKPKTLGVPILAGRAIDVSDANGSLPVAVVNQAFANAFLPDSIPVGHTLATAGADRQIVGLVGTARQRGSFGRSRGPVDETRTLFLRVSQVNGAFLKLMHTWFAPSWIVRVAGDPGAAIPGIERDAAVQVAVDGLLGTLGQEHAKLQRIPRFSTGRETSERRCGSD